MFIVFEGIDASGKTTQLCLVKKELESQGYNVCMSREPTFEPIGLLIRAILSKTIGANQFSSQEMALLFAADRCYHIRSYLKPMLDEGYIVLCDRYYHSTLSYQGVDEQSESLVRYLMDYAMIPDLTLIFDLDLEISKSRIEERKRADFTEVESVQKKAFNSYKEMEIKLPNENIVRIDASQGVEDVTNQIVKAILNLVGDSRKALKS